MRSVINDYTILVLLCMIFCHIVDDYYHQGILASMKQKQWWIDNAPQKMYRHDYIVALIAHAFSWSFTISIPPVVYLLLVGCTDLSGLIIMFILNFIVHAFVDNLKANMLVINLIEDQTLHVIQICSAWYVFIKILENI